MRTKITLPFFLLFTMQLAADVSLHSANAFEFEKEGWESLYNNSGLSFSSNPSFYGRPGYLINRSTTEGEGSRWTMWNKSPTWTGDYLGVGVNRFSFWADNRSGVGSSVSLRLALNGPGGWFVTEAVSVSDLIPGNEWAQYEFKIGTKTLIHVGQGSGSVEETLKKVTAIQLLVSKKIPTEIIKGGFLLADVSPSLDLRFDQMSVKSY